MLSKEIAEKREWNLDAWSTNSINYVTSILWVDA
jgi:hypothetical protein